MSSENITSVAALRKMIAAFDLLWVQIAFRFRTRVVNPDSNMNLYVGQSSFVNKECNSIHLQTIGNKIIGA